MREVEVSEPLSWVMHFGEYVCKLNNPSSLIVKIQQALLNLLSNEMGVVLSCAVGPGVWTLLNVHSLGRDEGSVSLNELMDLVTQLTNKVGGLENELKNTKKVYGTAITKLAKRVKKLEMQVKTGKASRRTKIVLSEDEAVEEDSSK
ncbi:hypothetical protein Tco_1158120 [Tanacetum coccineum]